MQQQKLSPDIVKRSLGDKITLGGTRCPRAPSGSLSGLEMCFIWPFRVFKKSDSSQHLKIKNSPYMSRFSASLAKLKDPERLGSPNWRMGAPLDGSCSPVGHICPFEFMTQKPVGSPWSGCLYPPGAHPDSHPRAAESEPVRGSLHKRPSRGPNSESCRRVCFLRMNLLTPLWPLTPLPL